MQHMKLVLARMHLWLKLHDCRSHNNEMKYKNQFAIDDLCDLEKRVKVTDAVGKIH